MRIIKINIQTSSAEDNENTNDEILFVKLFNRTKYFLKNTKKIIIDYLRTKVF